MENSVVKHGSRTSKACDSGFTLIELVITFILIGILSGIVVIAVNGANDRSNISACKVDFRSVQSAVASYLNDLGELTVPVSANKDLYSDTGTLITGGYLAKLTSDGLPYQIILNDWSTTKVAVRIGTTPAVESITQCDRIKTGGI